jgi:hypothetical protein
MIPRTSRLIPLVAASLALAAPAAASADTVQVTAFSVSPTCVHPGANVTASVTLQNDTYYPLNFVLQSWTTYYGAEVQRSSVMGPYPAAPFTPITQSQTTQIPWYAPWGTYWVNVGTGPNSSSPTSWSTRSAPLTVSAFC